jgi:hypothetical protein
MIYFQDAIIQPMSSVPRHVFWGRIIEGLTTHRLPPDTLSTASMKELFKTLVPKLRTERL